MVVLSVMNFLLKPSAVRCKVLQDINGYVIWVIEEANKTTKSLDMLKTMALEELYTVERFFDGSKRK